VSGKISFCYHVSFSIYSLSKALGGSGSTGFAGCSFRFLHFFDYLSPTDYDSVSGSYNATRVERRFSSRQLDEDECKFLA